MITIKNTNTSPVTIAYEGVSINLSPFSSMPIQETMALNLPSGVVIVAEHMLTEIDPYKSDKISENSSIDRHLLNETEVK